MIRRVLCRLGLHAWTFAYRPVGTGYRPEVFCLHCPAVSTRTIGEPRRLCRIGLHRRQTLTAPPTWKLGDASCRGRYCVWCSR